MVLELLLGTGAGYGLATWALGRRDPELRWDWSGYDPQDLTWTRRFPKDFLWGVATAAHQIEGGLEHNNWSRWETLTGPDGKPRIHNGERAGLACDHWRRFREDIQLMVDLGVQSYRLSLEWSRIEPSPGVYDGEAIARYHELLDAVIAAGLQPMITLHHFTHPLWFEDLGSFEKEENLVHIVRFTERMFQEYGRKARYWCTLNEPEVFASQGWFSGVFPPGKKDPQLTAVVLCNLLRAHGRMYRAIKALPGGHDVEVGLVKDIFQFEPDRRWHLGDVAVARVLDEVMNECILATLQSGHFRLQIPGMISLDASAVEAAGTLDFVGLNYYSHYHTRFRPDPAEPFVFRPQPGDTMTDMPYPIYPEGLYRALVRLAKIGAPIIITENGIADAADTRRDDFIRRYLYAVSKAIEDGVDVRGFYYWSLLDNFEWAEGWQMKFGLYAMDPVTRARTLREGSKVYPEIIRRSRAHE